MEFPGFLLLTETIPEKRSVGDGEPRIPLKPKWLEWGTQLWLAVQIEGVSNCDAWLPREQMGRGPTLTYEIGQSHSVIRAAHQMETGHCAHQ
jgi:hypothetical protein